MRRLKDLLTTCLANVGRARRFLVLPYRLWFHCLRRLNKNNAPQRVAALLYDTILGIVPQAIAAVPIVRAIPAYRQTGEQVNRIIHRERRPTRIEYPNPDNPEQHIAPADCLDQFIHRFFTRLDKGSLGLVIRNHWTSIPNLPQYGARGQRTPALTHAFLARPGQSSLGDALRQHRPKE